MHLDGKILAACRLLGMSQETNGRIRLAVRDIIAWAALLAAVLGSWWDGRTQQKLTQQALTFHVEAEREARAELKKQDELIWQAVREARAAERPQPRRR